MNTKILICDSTIATYDKINLLFKTVEPGKMTKTENRKTAPQIEHYIHTKKF